MTPGPEAQAPGGSPAPRKRLRIGDLLVSNGVISDIQLQAALAEQKRSGHKLGRTLVEMGFVEESAFLAFLSDQLRIPYIDLRHYQFDPKAARLLAETHARRYRSMVLADTGDSLVVGMVDPTDIYAFDELRRLLPKPLDLAVVREGELLNLIDLVYRRKDDMSDLAEELGEALVQEAVDLGQILASEKLADAPIVRFLQTLFDDAVQVGASDIHLEPDEQLLRIRQRVDGVLHEQLMKEHHIAPALTQRLKLLANLDISERRLPQDGRFQVKVRERTVDVRMSTMPLAHGEAVVMRLLDQSAGVQRLTDLGMPADLLARFRALLHRPHGMVLVTGPTGSGKTTTLYAALKELNQPEKKIITIEDPVEYRLPRLNQVQVNAKIGLDFATVLRAALRQDPDVVLVGEMRDQETVEIGLRAAMTGHLVLSTLHTNDAVSTGVRLLNMGAQGYLVAGSLLGVLAQRLVRRVCERCAADHKPDPGERAMLRAILPEAAGPETFKRGAGCPRCHNTGYRGRIGVFELLEIDTGLAEALRAADTSAFVRGAAAQGRLRPLAFRAAEYARAGLTSLEEVQRLAGEVAEVAVPGAPDPATAVTGGGA